MVDTDMPNTEANVENLASEVKSLKAEFSRIAALIEKTAKEAGAEAAARARDAGDKVWAQTQNTADNVAERIKEQPLASAGVAFGVGVLLGLIFGRR